ncbi:uncharacterized protein TNCV_4171451 [Trichonephila clavipes]|nr:uncharacterized protein TNCV_4171451 [Trichonephila clavipes]
MRNARVFNVWSEVYFSGSESVTEFLEGIDNQIKLLEIPSNLSCAYLKGHLRGRALDWYQIFGSTLVQNTATDFAQLKAALSKAFPAIQNKKELETRFYASQQRHNQKPTDFVYDLLKTHKKLELEMSEKALVDHIFVRLEPQVQDYVEVRNNEEIGEILKWYIDQIMVEMIIEVAIRTTVKEISGSRARIGFKSMIADLMIGDINLEIEVKMTILVEGTKEIGVRVKILVEAVENKWDV